MLSVVYAQCRYVECRYAEVRNATFPRFETLPYILLQFQVKLCLGFTNRPVITEESIYHNGQWCQAAAGWI